MDTECNFSESHCGSPCESCNGPIGWFCTFCKKNSLDGNPCDPSECFYCEGIIERCGQGCFNCQACSICDNHRYDCKCQIDPDPQIIYVCYNCSICRYCNNEHNKCMCSASIKIDKRVTSNCSDHS